MTTRFAGFPAASPQWGHEADRGGLIRRDFTFDDFTQAFSFMTQVALAAEKSDHHPEWSNVYNRVAIVLTTHDAGGLSMKDIELSRCIDELHARFAKAVPR
jgi:4a-hydroxytetrahydrobiopterin dehydratase